MIKPVIGGLLYGSWCCGVGFKFLLAKIIECF